MRRADVNIRNLGHQSSNLRHFSTAPVRSRLLADGHRGGGGGTAAACFETSWWKVVRWEHQRPRSGSNFSEDPGLTGIDTFQRSDNNWWCAWQVERHETALDRLLYRTFFSGPAEDEEDFDPVAVAGARRTLAPLLETSWLWKAQAPGEARSLSAIPPAPKSLGERAIAWAREGARARGKTRRWP
jgi:hypothetical protein